MSTSLEMFPDSGHHYFFIPLDAFKQNTSQYKAACDADLAPWKPVPEYSWIRRRFGKCGDNVGMWLAIETNFGTKMRGWVLEPKSEFKNDRELETAKSESALPCPYAYAKESDMPKSLRQEVSFMVGKELGEGFPVNLSIKWKITKASSQIIGYE